VQRLWEKRQNGNSMRQEKNRHRGKGFRLPIKWEEGQLKSVWSWRKGRVKEERPAEGNDERTIKGEKKFVEEEKDSKEGIQSRERQGYIKRFADLNEKGGELNFRGGFGKEPGGVIKIQGW